MDVVVPDIGDFTDVPVIEILVEVGQEVAAEDPLITLESDKATMEVPAPQAGVVRELKVALGDKVSEGTPILELQPVSADGGPPEPAAARPTGGGAAGGGGGASGRPRRRRRARCRARRLHRRLPRRRPRASHRARRALRAARR